MLTRLYRYGPSRHRIVKSYVVTDEKMRGAATELVQAAPGDLSIRVASPPREPTILSLDTGPVWLHSPESRAECFQALHRCVRHLADVAARRGATILPAAVAPQWPGSWRRWTCGDGHFLEVADVAEKEILCNLLRQHTPEIIALTGRAGIALDGVERTGSRRLIDSGRHYPCPFLLAASKTYLEHVALCLRRDASVENLSQLDVNPVVESGDGSWVEIRCNDGQALLASVRAQALFYAALSIRARRLAQHGTRLFPTDQRILVRNRWRAIMDGMNASFSVITARGQMRTEGALPSSVRLLEGLMEEFQMLDAQYDELAPLVSGLSLKNAGFAATRNETDFLRSRRQAAGRAADPRKAFVAEMQQLVQASCEAAGEVVGEWNERHFAEACQTVRQLWQLRRAAKPNGKSIHRQPHDLLAAVTESPSRGGPRGKASAANRSRDGSKRQASGESTNYRKRDGRKRASKHNKGRRPESGGNAS